MSKAPKRRAYLVSVLQKRAAARVYAVVAGTPDEALEAVALHAPKAEMAIVGGLSRDLVKRMRLKLGEMRLVWYRLARPPICSWCGGAGDLTRGRADTQPGLGITVTRTR